MVTIREEVFINVGGTTNKFIAQRQIAAFDWDEFPKWLKVQIVADLKRSLEPRVVERVSTITVTKKFS